MFLDYIKTLCHYLIPKKTLTQLMGRLAAIEQPRFKNTFIRIFIWLYQVNLQEAQQESIDEYTNFNDFFTRYLKPESRPLAPVQVISPVDGYIAQFGQIDKGQLFQAKGKPYDIRSLLAADPTYADAFANGLYATFYLSPKDYHRVHMPIEGKLLETIYVPGTLFSVQPTTTRTINHIFARNERLICLFDTPLGLMASIMVGATIVGSIATSWGGVVPRKKEIERLNYQTEEIAQPHLPQGGEMGFFQMGSTVILLFADRQALQWSEKLSIGQPIQFGQELIN